MSDKSNEVFEKTRLITDNSKGILFVCEQDLLNRKEDIVSQIQSNDTQESISCIVFEKNTEDVIGIIESVETDIMFGLRVNSYEIDIPEKISVIQYNVSDTIKDDVKNIKLYIESGYSVILRIQNKFLYECIRDVLHQMYINDINYSHTVLQLVFDEKANKNIPLPSVIYKLTYVLAHTLPIAVEGLIIERTDDSEVKMVLDILYAFMPVTNWVTTYTLPIFSSYTKCCKMTKLPLDQRTDILKI